MINFDRDKIMGFPIYTFLPPTEAASAIAAMNKTFLTGKSIFHSYSFRDVSFLWLIVKIDEDVVTVHETFDVIGARDRLEKFLSVASGNFYRTLYNKETG
jgi:hypothetical protein